jgi:hypothetical protein
MHGDFYQSMAFVEEKQGQAEKVTAGRLHILRNNPVIK